MFKPVSFLLQLWLLAPFLLGAQSTPKDFSAVDSLARTIRYGNDIYKLTKELTSAYTEPLLKTRAIFAWVTDNIRYDYKFVNKGKEIKTPDCKPGVNCREMLEEWGSNYIKKVLKKKKGVCDGYARVFKKMCDIAGIPCEIIGGYTKTKPYQVGGPGTLNHAWNAVFIDSAWHLLDVTWASGGCGEEEESGKLLPFKKHFDDYYWFTSFHDLARNHYPKDGKWVVEPGYTKEKFADNPWYAAAIIDNIHLASPSSGVVSVKEGDTYAFDYVVTDESLYYVEILFDYNKAMKFNIKVEAKQPA